MSLINFKKRETTIAVVIGNANAIEFKLGELEELTGCKIISIEAYSNSQVTKSLAGEPVVDSSILNSAYLILQTNGNEELVRRPLISLNKTANNLIVSELNLPAIDTNKSIIKVPTGTALVAGQCFLLKVVYEKK